MPDTVEECTIACWPKKTLDKLGEQMTVVHDFVLAEQTRQTARKEARDEFHKSVKTWATIITIALAILSGLWATFRIVSPEVIPHAEAQVSGKINK